MRKHSEIYIYSIRISVQCIRTSVQCIQTKTTNPVFSTKQISISFLSILNQFAIDGMVKTGLALHAPVTHTLTDSADDT